MYTLPLPCLAAPDSDTGSCPATGHDSVIPIVAGVWVGRPLSTFWQSLNRRILVLSCQNHRCLRCKYIETLDDEYTRGLYTVMHIYIYIRCLYTKGLHTAIDGDVYYEACCVCCIGMLQCCRGLSRRALGVPDALCVARAHLVGVWPGPVLTQASAAWPDSVLCELSCQ